MTGMLDSVTTVETPEGIELHLHPAGPAPRALAWGLDALIRLVLYAVLGMGSAFFGGLGLGLFLIIAFFMEWFYGVFFEVLKNGATPGKQALGLRVVHADGTPVGWSASIIRNLLRVVDFLPAAYGFALVSMLMTRRFQRLGDLTADTLVVFKQERPGTTALDNGAAIRSPVTLMPEEAQSIIAFAERAARLNPERAEELAALATPLGEDNRPPNAARLKGIANWLLGRQA
ncbi:MAG: RDD family protein [Gammaproteobacteria bacterium]